jgi:hypothetical protein
VAVQCILLSVFFMFVCRCVDLTCRPAATHTSHRSKHTAVCS